MKEETNTDPDSVASVQHQFLLKQWKYLRDYHIFSLLGCKKTQILFLCPWDVLVQCEFYGFEILVRDHLVKLFLIT